MPAAMRRFAVAEHIMHQRKACVFHTLQQKLRNRRKIVRLCVKRTIIAMCLRVCFEPWLVVERLGLDIISSNSLASRMVSEPFACIRRTLLLTILGDWIIEQSSPSRTG